MPIIRVALVMEYWPPQTFWFSRRACAMSKLTVDVADALSTIPYLRELPPGERRSLAAQCSIRMLCAGERAFMEGDRPDGVYLIIAGRVRLMRSSPGGREQVLHEEGPGMTLGEVPVFDGEGYVGSAVATEDATVLFVPGRRFSIACVGTRPALPKSSASSRAGCARSPRSWKIYRCGCTSADCGLPAA